MSVMLIVAPVLCCAVIDCGDPGTPQNGARTGNSFTFESTVSYTCNDGYELQGSATQTCQQTSRWTDQRPVCARKIQHNSVWACGSIVLCFEIAKLNAIAL